MRRRAATLLGPVTAMAVLLAGCSSLPHSKPSSDRPQPATSVAAAGNALLRYSAARSQADAALDAGVLADIEDRSLLAIDTGGFTIRRALAVAAPSPELGDPDLVLRGGFSAYPLWYAVVAPAPEEGTRAVLVFARASATEPWRVVTAPRLAPDTALPEPAVGDDGTADLLDPDSADGLAASPDQVARAYAAVLASGRSGHADEFAADSFITQMRAAVAAQPTDDVRFSQSWRAEPVRYAIAVKGGGALVFVDLIRVDRYHAVGDHRVSFDGAEASAFLTTPDARSASLTYRHEVLLYVPEDGPAFALGQYGGLVSATSHP